MEQSKKFNAKKSKSEIALMLILRESDYQAELTAEERKRELLNFDKGDSC